MAKMTSGTKIGAKRRGHGRGHDANLSIEVARLNASAKAMQEAKRKEREHTWDDAVGLVRALRGAGVFTHLWH